MKYNIHLLQLFKITDRTHYYYSLRNKFKNYLKLKNSNNKVMKLFLTKFLIVNHNPVFVKNKNIINSDNTFGISDFLTRINLSMNFN